MKTWIAEFSVRSEVVIPEGQTEIEFPLPGRDCKIVARSASRRPKEEENLAIYVVVSASDISAADKLTDTIFSEFLHAARFIVSARMRKLSKNIIMDWSDDLMARDCWVWSPTMPQDFFDDLKPEIVQSIAITNDKADRPILKRALRWYSAGIQSEIAEDQFEMFWRSIELLAVADRDNFKVSDKCPRCRGDLFCLNCEEISTHKPFPKQAIEKLFAKMGIDYNKTSDLFAIRNGLAHGEEAETLETKIKGRDESFVFESAVNLVGQIACRTILQSLPKDIELEKLSMYLTNDYVRKAYRAKIICGLGLASDVGERTIDAIRIPEVDFVFDEHQVNDK